MSYKVNSETCNNTYSRNNYMGIQAPEVVSAGYYVVPNYSAPGYTTLQHGHWEDDHDHCHDRGNSEYFRIGMAYGPNANNCAMSYTTRQC